jgi:hypothetical protein
MEKVHVVVKIEKKDTDRRDEQEEEVTEYVVHPAASANAPSPKGRLESGTPLEAARPQQAKVSGRIAVEDNACTPDGVRHERRYAEVLPFASIFGVSYGNSNVPLVFYILCCSCLHELCRQMNTETNARRQPVPGLSRHLGNLVALLAGGQRHHKDFRDAQAHPKDRARMYITFGYNKQLYVSYGIVRERGVNRRREVVFVAPPLCATLRSFCAMRQCLLCASQHSGTPLHVSPQFSLYPLILQTLFFFAEWRTMGLATLWRRITRCWVWKENRR